jgi:hypothetical protein
VTNVVLDVGVIPRSRGQGKPRRGAKVAILEVVRVGVVASGARGGSSGRRGRGAAKRGERGSTAHPATRTLGV